MCERHVIKEKSILALLFFLFYLFIFFFFFSLLYVMLFSLLVSKKVILFFFFFLVKLCFRDLRGGSISVSTAEKVCLAPHVKKKLIKFIFLFIRVQLYLKVLVS